MADVKRAADPGAAAALPPATSAAAVSGTGVGFQYPRKALNVTSFTKLAVAPEKLETMKAEVREFYTTQNEWIGKLVDAERIRRDSIRIVREQQLAAREERRKRQSAKQKDRAFREAARASTTEGGVPNASNVNTPRQAAAHASAVAEAAVLSDTVSRLQIATGGGGGTDDKHNSSAEHSRSGIDTLGLLRGTTGGSHGTSGTPRHGTDDEPEPEPEMDVDAGDEVAIDIPAHMKHSFQNAPGGGAEAGDDPNAGLTLDEGGQHPNVRLATKVSFVANIMLFVVKVFAAAYSGSLAIIASAVDSFLDIGSSLVLYLAAKATEGGDFERYPEGKARLEPLAVIVFSVIMGMTSVELITQAVQDMIDGFTSGAPRGLTINFVAFGILFGVIVVKLALNVYCRVLGSVIEGGSPAIDALCQDHVNDVVTNVLAVVAVVVVRYNNNLWWFDPLAALLFSLYIIKNWTAVAQEQSKSIVGNAASPVLVSQITYIAMHHKGVIEVDTVRAYSIGQGYLTEVDVVLPRSLPLHTAHDIGEALELALERLPGVQRALVHLDFESSHEPEYKRRRPGGGAATTTTGSPRTASANPAASPASNSGARPPPPPLALARAPSGSTASRSTNHVSVWLPASSPPATGTGSVAMLSVLSAPPLPPPATPN